MFKRVNPKQNFAELEKKILKFWEEKKIFEKLQQKNKGKKRWSFIDGPITANNPMGVHHAWGRTLKDLYQRYMAMRGFDQRFQNGFDCQGLWVEVEVEKDLGFKSKKDIEEYGIENFVNKCKERVKKYSQIQTQQSIRLGQWMDWENSYYTMSDENNYAIWAFLKKCKEKEFLYKGRDVVPWCPRCGAAISQHEILTEEYKELTHKAIFFKLPAKGQKNTFFLVWTTTPWTLPGNVALAVHLELSYAKVKDKKGDSFILLEKKADLVKGGKIVEKIAGEKLVGLEYEGLFDELPEAKKALGKYHHSVIPWKEVSEEEGTGIVHIAPGCGQEDFQLSKEFKLPVIDLTDDESNYREGFGELSGRFVGEVGDWIFDNLEKKNRVFKIEDYLHRYPTCWRCQSELIFRLVDEWYISMEKLRKPLMTSARKIEWNPDFGLERELDWLKNMHDWLISKKRYWGLALPIFECPKCHNFEVIGSKEELKERAVEGWEKFEGHSPHRPWVDEVRIKCLKCGNLISRIPDVGSPWLDAGIVPFSTLKYFEDRIYWRKWFPAEFVCESFPGQFKNWFYVMLVMSEVLEGKPPFKKLLGYAAVVDEKGKEMHKSKGNAIWFDEAVEKMGADVMRWLYISQNPALNLFFGYNAAAKVREKIYTLWNVYSFFVTYALVANWKKPSRIVRPKSINLLDQWVISRFYETAGDINKFLNNTEPHRAMKDIDGFIDDLSNWYLRRSRRRFQREVDKKDKELAFKTLHWILVEFAKLMAPFLPMLAETIFRNLGTKEISVHLCDYPKASPKLINKSLNKEMRLTREIVALGLAARAKAGIKVRQPLDQLQIANCKLQIEFLDLVKEELNVKNISITGDIGRLIESGDWVIEGDKKLKVALDTKITEDLREEGTIRELVRQIQEMRKDAGYDFNDKVLLRFSSSGDKLPKVISRWKERLAKEVIAHKVEEGEKPDETFDVEKEFSVFGENIWLGIRK